MYLPAFNVIVIDFVPPWNVGVAAIVGPLVPDCTVTL